MNQTKKWYKSKTYWFNIALAGLGILEVNVHLLQENLGSYYGYSVIVIGIAGVMLRNVTSTSIEKKQKPTLTKEV